MQNKRITIAELERYLFTTADYLRSVVDAGEYKQYIFPLLFYKRLCDVYDEETAKAVEKYGEDLSDFDEEDLHAFLIPAGKHWNDIRNTPENVGEAIVEAFQAIESANGDKFVGIFGNGAWSNKNKFPDTLLKDILEHFSSLTLSLENCPEDELGNGYEYLIRQFADDSGHTAQEFYTNRTVVHLMTELLQPKSGETFYDPTCGTMGMGISCIAYLKAHGKEWRNLKIYGQEVNALTAAISKINLILHGIETFEIANGDTLADPAFIENGQLKKFSICLANPPYSISTWNRDAFAADKYGRYFLGVPNQNRADFAFIAHIVKSLDETNGRCAILLPHGILNRYEEQAMRKKLLELDLIECVIGVGKNLFYNSPMEACILICRTRKNPDRKGKVLFINAVDLVEKRGKDTYLNEEHISQIKNAYSYYCDVNEFCRVVAVEDIIGANASLSISLYVTRENQDSLQNDKNICDYALDWNKSISEAHCQFDVLSGLLKG